MLELMIIEFILSYSLKKKESKYFCINRRHDKFSILQFRNKISIYMNPGAFLRDTRKIKKNNTVTLSMTTKDIRSVKDFSKSSEKMIFNKFSDNKNEKIKSIDQKLEVHQSQIDKNNGIIEQLNSNFSNLRNQLIKEKERAENQGRRNRLLKDEIERTTKLLRIKNIKFDEVTKKLLETEKQVQNLKMIAQKYEDMARVNGSLRKQATHLEEILTEKKVLIIEKEKENEKLRQKLKESGNVSFENEKNKKTIVAKQEEIEGLSKSLANLESQNCHLKEVKNLQEKQILEITVKLEENSKRLCQKQKQLKDVKQSETKLKETVFQIEKEKADLDIKIRTKDSFESSLKNQLNSVKHKLDEVNSCLRNKSYEEKQRIGQIQTQEQKILDLKTKLNESETTLFGLKESHKKVELLQKKSKTLDHLYQSIIPQIQCPFGHELINPVTIIPCGHNYCLSCKRGYTKDCIQCNGKLKIEAVYRNELMDDIIEMVSGIKQVLQIIK